MMTPPPPSGVGTFLNLGLFFISEDPPPNFEVFPTETWDFFDFLTTLPPLIWTVSQISPLFSLESFPNQLSEKSRRPIFLIVDPQTPSFNDVILD